MKPLTIKQAIIYDFIKRFINENGYSPSVREICKGVQLSSTATVHKHLLNLKIKDCITFEKNKPRTIKII